MEEMVEGKRRGRPVPDAINIKHIIFKLEETLSIENVDRPNLLLFENERSDTNTVVTLPDRDRSVDLLKFLRVWFDLPQRVFFDACTYLDLFLTKMKVKGKFLSCVTVSCFYLAATRHETHLTAAQLVSISQSKCSVKDMHRMADIITHKLHLKNDETRIITAFDFLQIYFDILEHLADQFDDVLFQQTVLQRSHLMSRLVAIVSDSSCAFYKPSVLAFALIRREFDQFFAQSTTEIKLSRFKEIYNFVTVLAHLQLTCDVRVCVCLSRSWSFNLFSIFQIKETELSKCLANVSKVLSSYENNCKMKQHAELVWRFSSSTIAKSNVKNRHHQYKYLNTISE